jgi:copper chaperone CopZ
MGPSNDHQVGAPVIEENNNMLSATTRIVMIGLMIGVLALMGLVAGQPQSLAQDADPAPDATNSPHPAHIHAGSCGSLDSDERFALSDVTMAATDPTESASAVPVAIGVTTINATLTDTLAGEYAIDVHESVQNAERSIACGEIGGPLVGNELAIGLKEQDGSGYVGIAWLHAEGDKTVVSVFLAQGLASATSGADDKESMQEQVTFYVETVTCPSCPIRVEGSINQVPGIRDITWQGKQVTVTYDPDQVTPDEIRTAIEGGGDTAYEVTEKDEE